MNYLGRQQQPSGERPEAFFIGDHEPEGHVSPALPASTTWHPRVPDTIVDCRDGEDMNGNYEFLTSSNKMGLNKSV